MYFIAPTAFERLKDENVLNLAAWIIPQILQKWTLALLWITTKESYGNIRYRANWVAGVTMVTVCNTS